MLTILLGLWLMASPAVFSYGDAAATNDYIIGPIISGFACIAIWEILRPLRWLNLALALWLIASLVFIGYPVEGTWNALAVGIAVVALSFFGGSVRQQFGGGWSSLWR